MGYLNRLLLFLYTLASSVFFLLLIAISLNLIPMYVLMNEIKFLLSCKETLIVLALFFLLSIYFLGASLTSSSKQKSKKNNIVILTGKVGIIELSPIVLRKMIEHVLYSINGITKVKVDISTLLTTNASQSVLLQLSIYVSDECRFTNLSDLVHKRINNLLKDTVGLTDFSVNVSIVDVSNKKQRIV